MVTVKITETYDMKTTVNKVGVVGVHTPTTALLRRLYPGLMKNHRYMRFVKCDVVGACASVLPADPLQVGVTNGQVAPEDMFNPILYTAVTNSSFDTLIARVNALSDVNVLESVASGNLAPNMSAENNFKIYYALLSENGKFRKSMPQTGFAIKGLVPLAHTLVSTFGNVGSIANEHALAEDGENSVPIPELDIPTLNDGWSDSSKESVMFRGKSVKMPRFPIHTARENYDAVPNPAIPNTMVLAMILPPAKLHEFYYRMRVTWTIRFEKIISALEIDGTSSFLDAGNYAHGQNYTYTSSKAEMENVTDMLDGTDVEISKIMES